MHYDFSAW